MLFEQGEEENPRCRETVVCDLVRWQKYQHHKSDKIKGERAEMSEYLPDQTGPGIR